jgi:hypothetical protein
MFNFTKVADGLYRGSAPSKEDVKDLYDLGIRKIVSLDRRAGERIHDIAEKLHIQHIMLPLEFDIGSMKQLLALDIGKLLGGGPTFVHCQHGKDRTGLVVGMYEGKCLGKSYDSVIKNALSFGFGIGVNRRIVEMYKQILRKYCEDGRTGDENCATDVPGLPATIRTDYEWTGHTGNVGGVKPIPSQDDGDTSLTYFSKSQPVGFGGTTTPPYAGLSESTKNIFKLYTGGRAMTTQRTKLAANIPMSLPIPESHKKAAYLAIVQFDVANKELMMAKDYLVRVRTFFKDNAGLPPEEIVKSRVSLRHFRDRAIEKMNIFKVSAEKCIRTLSEFVNDTQIMKLIKSFNNSVNDIELDINSEFVELFSNLEDKSFSDNLVKSIDKIENKISEISDLMVGRIKRHLQEHILGSTWLDTVKNTVETDKIDLDKNEPLLLKLRRETAEKAGK